ncbi:MAG: N-acetylmuramoyl-L-alanine amidase family protein [Ruminiclostridium sp.]
MWKKALALLAIFAITAESGAFSVTTYANELISKNGEIYYLDDSGKAQTGWQTIDGNKYYFKKDGTAVTKSCIISGIRYKFTSDGVCQGEYTGWTTSSNGRRYYKNGVMITNKWITTKSGKRYYAGEDGYIVTGWNKLSKGWYYFNESGVMMNGDVKVNGKTYTFSESGVCNGKADYDNTKIYSTLKKKLSNDDYGGIYFDGNVVVVMSKNNDEVVKLTEELKKLYAPIVIRKCNFSVNELEEVRSNLEKNSKKYGISAVYTEVKNNRVCIEMKKSNSSLNAYIKTLDNSKIVHIEYTDTDLIDD